MAYGVQAATRQLPVPPDEVRLSGGPQPASHTTPALLRVKCPATTSEDARRCRRGLGGAFPRAHRMTGNGQLIETPMGNRFMSPGQNWICRANPRMARSTAVSPVVAVRVACWTLPAGSITR